MTQPVLFSAPPDAQPSHRVRTIVLELTLIAFALFSAYSIGVLQERKAVIAGVLGEAQRQLDAARQAHARAAQREAEAEALRKRLGVPTSNHAGEIHVAEVSSL